ncbi:MAG: KTSC domain-containing protein [Hoeflea sp.]|nr:KTSC domain-containing protein [Hoeflea sp.]
MERQPVSSSSLASVGYNSDSETLEVEFVSTGKVYEYYNVPQFVYDRLMEAPSIGQYFNAEIRNAYSCSPV